MNDSGSLSFGHPLYRYDVVGSTQDVAREWVVRGAPPGTVVTARAMTAGRGRRGRVWHVPPGANVCLTAVGPEMATDALWQVALVAGLAVVLAAEEVAPSVLARLRFPNDVYVCGRKLSGILVEAVPGRAGDGLIPLIGIDVNVRAAPLPDDVADRAISLEEASGAQTAVEDVQSALLSALSLIWDQWEKSGLPTILTEWRRRAESDAWRIFLFEGVPTPCRVMDIMPDGTVFLEAKGGQRRKLHATHVILGDD